MDEPAAEEGQTRPRGGRLLSLVVRVLLPLALLAAGWIGYSTLATKPEEAKRPPPEPRAIKTRAVELHVEDFPSTVSAGGVTRPHNEVTLTPQVSGRISRVLPGFEDGAFFAAGDVLVELDPQDFETAVIVAMANRARAISAHALEQTRSDQAKLNWDELYDEEPTELVLRLPQLREAEANVKAAEAQLEQANRNLERANVRAPFAGRVRQRTVGVGQSVGPGTPLGTIFAIDYAEVRLPITAEEMAFLELPEVADDPPVDVKLRDALGHGETVWHAQIIRREGALDQSSLELFAIARVDDPFGRESGLPPLRIGQPVVGTIPGHILEDVLVAPRKAVRQLDRIVLINPRTLTIETRTIEPIWSSEDRVVFRDETIPDGWLLATTNLVYAPVGSTVEILPDPEDEVNGDSNGSAVPAAKTDDAAKSVEGDETDEESRELTDDDGEASGGDP